MEGAEVARGRFARGVGGYRIQGLKSEIGLQGRISESSALRSHLFEQSRIVL